MKINGVTNQEQDIIKEILSPYTKDYDFFYYGSRVRGNFEPTSDLDLLIHGKSEMPTRIYEKIKKDFDDSKLPFIINMTDFFNIDEKFYSIIKKDLIKV